MFYTLTHTNSILHTLKPTLSLKHTQTHSHTLSLSLSLSFSLSLSYTQTHTHTHKHTHPPCNWGSTMSGHRSEFIMMVAFSLDIRSDGRPSFAHPAITASSIRSIRKSKSAVVSIGH